MKVKIKHIPKHKKPKLMKNRKRWLNYESEQARCQKLIDYGYTMLRYK